MRPPGQMTGPPGPWRSLSHMGILLRMRRRRVRVLGLALGLASTCFAWDQQGFARHATQSSTASASTKPAGSGTATLGSAGAWSAYASSDKTGRVCYLVGQPQKSESAGVTRTPPSAMVTHRPAENIANVVSFVEGYALKDGSDVRLEIGDRKFDLFTRGDSAWARTSELDRTIVTTLAQGRTAIVHGISQNGRTTTDTYSLSGFDKALALIDKACGVQRESETKSAPHPSQSHSKRHRTHH